MRHLVLKGCDFFPAVEGTLSDFACLVDRGAMPWKQTSRFDDSAGFLFALNLPTAGVNRLSLASTFLDLKQTQSPNLNDHNANLSTYIVKPSWCREAECMEYDFCNSLL
jgi:hypothetical protein